ncbi:MAG: hypothetical protein AAGE65_09635 [Planctomycetota bacterium]
MPPSPPPPSPSRSEPPPLRCTPLVPLLPGWVALPADKAHALMRRAEALHDTIADDATYPLDFVAFKLTGFRRDYGDAALLFGVPLAHDLRWVVDAITRAHPVALTSEAKSAEDWAKQIGVHPRTLRRWRDAGLRWRWSSVPGRGSPIVTHTAEAIDRFRARHPERFEKARQFKPLTAAQKRDVIRRASELSAVEPERSLSGIAKAIADELGRAHETIRLILLKHAERGRSEAVFPKAKPILSSRQRRQTLRDRRRGVSLRELGRRVGKSGPTLHRWLAAHRATVLRRLDLEHVASPLFDRDDAAEVYLRGDLPEPALDPTRGHGELLAGLPGAAADRVRTTRRWDEDTRRSALLRMNFLKHTADAARTALPRDGGLRARDLDRIEALVRDAGRLRRQLVRGELAHLLSLLRRQAPAGIDLASVEFARMFRDGLTVLVEAVKTYNASGNRRFETYLRNRLQRALAARQSAVVLTVEAESSGSADDRRRAVRRDAPSEAEAAWADALRELRRWTDDPPLPEARQSEKAQPSEADAQDASA